MLKTWFNVETDAIQISLDSFGWDNNRDIDSNDIIKNIKLLNQIGIEPRVNSVLTKWSLNGILPLVRKLNQNTNINSLSLRNPIGKTNLKLWISEEESIILKKALEEIRPQISFDIFDSFYGIITECKYSNANENGIVRCTAMRSKLCIATNGDVYPCVFLERRIQSFGNINNSNLLDIWRSEKSAMFAENLLVQNNKCKTCKKTRECLQKCAGMSI